LGVSVCSEGQFLIFPSEACERALLDGRLTFDNLL
jgi:hypothetical protein